LNELHKTWVAHSDIKAANIFLHFENEKHKIQTPLDLLTSKPRIVLGDLGLCTLYEAPDKESRGEKGTRYFYSPEIWFENRMSLKADIWAMGCLGLYLFLNNYMIPFE
jgi:serine/threonine protein kinase